MVRRQGSIYSWPGKKRLSITIDIWNAKNLPAADSGFLIRGKSDPYCKVSIVGRPFVYQTQTQMSTLEPTWDEKTTLTGVCEGDMLYFEVWDEDQNEDDDFLGNCFVKWPAIESGMNNESLMLDTPLPQKKGMPASLKVSISVREPVEDDSQRRIFVRVMTARNLPTMTPDRTAPDTYVEVGFLRKPQSAWTTKIIKNDAAPAYNEEGELYNCSEDDVIKFSLVEVGPEGEATEVGSHMISSAEISTMLPHAGEQSDSMVEFPMGDKAFLRARIGIREPPPKPIDPGTHVDEYDRGPVPFMLRSLDHGRTHRLLGYTRIGRSQTQLDPLHDLVLDQEPVSLDVRRWHATIKVWRDVYNPSGWSLRIYSAGGPHGKRDMHAWRGEQKRPQDLSDRDLAFGFDAGTRIDDVPVNKSVGTEIFAGSIIRFGFTEVWAVESSQLFPKSAAIAFGATAAKIMALEDPTLMRELRVETIDCYQAIVHCTTWFDLAVVILEFLGEPDEPPCLDMIEVRDECNKPVSRHEIETIEDCQEYPVSRILREVRIGSTVRVRYSNEPVLLASTLELKEDRQEEMEKAYKTRIVVPAA